MSDAPNGSPHRGRLPESDSHGTVDLYFDGPGDNTIRPCPPELLESAHAMREKLIRYGAMQASGSPTRERIKPEADNGTLRVPIDEALLSRLHGLNRPIELVDANGQVVAQVVPVLSEASQGQPGQPGGEAPPKK